MRASCHFSKSICSSMASKGTGSAGVAEADVVGGASAPKPSTLTRFKQLQSKSRAIKSSSTMVNTILPLSAALTPISARPAGADDEDRAVVEDESPLLSDEREVLLQRLLLLF
jgi:hypothetical protein